MLTAVRAMAQPRRPRPRAHGHAAARPRRHRRGAGRSCSPRCSRTRSRPARRRSSAGPSSWPCCARPGVVDAGAYGLTVIIAGCLAALRGEAAPRARAPVRAGGAAPARARVVELPLLHELRRHRRRASTRAPLRRRARGDRRLGARGRRRPHAARARPHRRPGRARWRCSTDAGEVSRFDVADMHEQVADRSARLSGDGAARPSSRPARSWRWRAATGVKRLYEELGVLVVDGGATMNPSTYELLAGHPRGARRRGGRAAEQPQRDPGRRARRRAVREAGARGAHHRAAGGAGRAARVRPERGAGGRTPRAVASAAEALRIGGVAPAARDDAQGRFAAGDAVGYAGGELVAWGDPAETLAATLGQLADGAELLTCIAGDGAAARPATTWRRASRTASSWSTTRAGSPPGGGCSARSDGNRPGTGPGRRARGRLDHLREVPDPGLEHPAGQHGPAPRRAGVGAPLQLPARTAARPSMERVEDLASRRSSTSATARSSSATGRT